MKGKGLGFVIGGAIGMLMSLVWFIIGGVFVASIMKTSEKAKKEEA